jgi:hypothetical protein
MKPEDNKPSTETKQLPANFDTALRPNVWLPGVSGNPNGRPRKFMTQMKDAGYKHSEILDTIKALLACTAAELKEIVEDTSGTVLERTVANALGKALVAGSLHPLETLITRAWGMPKETIEEIHSWSTPMIVQVVESGPPIVSREDDVQDAD